MTDELELALRRTLTEAAERAPKAPPGLAADLRSRRSTRLPRLAHHGTVRLALAAAMVVAVLGGATLFARTLLPSGTREGGSTKVLQRPRPVKAPPIEQVWPDAVRTVPKTLPNGRTYTPQAFLDDHTILVSTESGVEKPDALYAYDLRTHAAKKITAIVDPPHATDRAEDFAAGNGYATWYFSGKQGLEIWAAPISGGTARRIVTQPRTKGQPTRMIIDHGDVVWSVNGSGGVYRAPLTGGAPEPVPGAKGMHILAWPWVGSPAGVEGVGTKKNEFDQLRNLRTGETRSAHLTLDVTGMWACGLTWCTGNGRGGAIEVEHRDGSDHHAIPGQGVSPGDPPALDRFVITTPTRTTAALYDLKTRRMGDLGAVGKDNGVSFQALKNPADRLCWSDAANGYLIIDLGAIS